MKIAIITAFFPPNNMGGAEISSYYLAKILARKGNEVHIIAPDFGKKRECMEFKKENSDLHLHYIQYPLPIKSDIIKMRLLTYNPLYILLLFIKIVNIVKKYDIDIIHAHQNEDNIPSWLASRITRRPIVLNLYDIRFVCELSLCLDNGIVELNCGIINYLKCSWTLSKISNIKIIHFLGSLYLYLYMCFNKIVLKKADRIIAISKFLKKLATGSGFDNNNIKVIYQITNFISDIEDANLTFGNHKVISFAGRLDPKKGVHILIEAFKEVRKEIPSKLVIIGDTNNEYSSNLKLLVNKLDLEEDCIFMGKLHNKQVLGIFKNSDLVVVPSIWPEPQGRTVLEALHVGTPVVASDIGGIPELIDKSDGLLVRPNDKNALKDGILKILNCEIKTAPSSILKKYLDTDFIYSQTIEVYKEAISQYKGSKHVVKYMYSFV